MAILGFLYDQFCVYPQVPEGRFDGQIVIITGSNVGLGKEAARHIARKGAAKIILAVNSIRAGEGAKADILSSIIDCKTEIEVWMLNLLSWDSVKEFAARAKAELPRVDVLLENAGVAPGSFSLAGNGFERTIAVNVVGTFLLGLLMVPQLKATAIEHNVSPRLVVVASSAHHMAILPETDENIFDVLNDEPEGPIDMTNRYSVTKLMDLLVVRELASKLKGTGIIISATCPGMCRTSITREQSWIVGFVMRMISRTAEVGGRTLTAAAVPVGGEKANGSFCSNGVVANEAISPWVKSEKGQKTQKKIYTELMEVLEKIEPGITKF